MKTVHPFRKKELKKNLKDLKEKIEILSSFDGHKVPICLEPKWVCFFLIRDVFDCLLITYCFGLCIRYDLYYLL